MRWFGLTIAAPITNTPPISYSPGPVIVRWTPRTTLTLLWPGASWLTVTMSARTFSGG
ncbi:MAG: hypothetical protein M5R40_04340 [Anaerolineae bacterium]|nr:hypothetical protein [Anaerolineae bacterium]